MRGRREINNKIDRKLAALGRIVGRAPMGRRMGKYLHSYHRPKQQRMGDEYDDDDDDDEHPGIRRNHEVSGHGGSFEHPGSLGHLGYLQHPGSLGRSESLEHPGSLGCPGSSSHPATHECSAHLERLGVAAHPGYSIVNRHGYNHAATRTHTGHRESGTVHVTHHTGHANPVHFD